MQITLQLDRDIAHELRHGQPPSVHTREILSTIEALQLSLRPIHPGTADSDMDRYFTVDLDDEASGEELRQRLEGCIGVEAAYIKPADELP